jgi:site-specific recombinase XerD
MRVSALRFLYKKTLKRRDLAFDDLVYPKRPKRLPAVLSPEEVTRLIEATPNPMHRPFSWCSTVQAFAEAKLRC